MHSIISIIKISIVIMQTVIGIVICLIVGIYFLIGFMNNNENSFMNMYEGYETKTTSATTTTPVTTNGIPLTTAVANSANALTTIKTIVPAINNGDNKTLYVEHIDNLLDYCDYAILHIINNATLNEESAYNPKVLDEIVRYAKIKDALNGSLSYLDSV
jgi:hypothetical protein